jgi:molecular chaperone GrpE
MTDKHKHKHEHGQQTPSQPASESPGGQAQTGAGAQSAPPLADELSALRTERDDLLSRLQRLSAEYLNYQKRAAREMTEARDYANASLIKDLLGPLDDLDRALEAADATKPADDPLVVGVKLVRDKAGEILARYGLKEIEALGQSFDPNRHEALVLQPYDNHTSPIVLRVLQKGYELKNRVLRPARVIVSAPPSGQPEPAPDVEQ